MMNIRSRRWLLLLPWLLGILFPLAWLGTLSPAYRRIFDAIFAPLWMHIVMHLLLFGGLVLLLAFAFRPRRNWRALAVLLGAALVIGMCQEVFQALSSGMFSLTGSLFDLGVDLAGAIVGGVIYGMAPTKSRA
jgi:hypothetical protein